MKKSKLEHALDEGYEAAHGCFFGGGGSSGGTTTTTQELAPEQKELLSLVIPEARKIMQSPPELFPRSAIAGFNPLQQQGQQATVNAAQGSLTDIAGQGANAFQFLTGDVLDPSKNPGIQGSIDAAVRPLTREYTQSVLPGIRGEAITAGGYGGSRQGIAEGLAAQGYQTAVGDTTSNIVSRAYDTGLDAYTRGLALAPTVAQMQLQPGVVLEGVGAQQQSLEQAQLSEEAQRYLSEQVLPFSVAQDVAALAFGIGGGKSVSQSNASGSASPLSSAAGIASIGASLAMMMCAISRAAYGYRDPRWMLFREWLYREAPAWLFRFYGKHSWHVARVIHGRKYLRAAVRLILNVLRRL